MNPMRTLLSLVLAAAPLAGGAHADGPGPTPEPAPEPAPAPPIDWHPWRAAFDATGIAPAECGELFVEAFDAGAGATPPGKALERVSGEAVREPFGRIAAHGGIPFSDMRGGMRRVAVRFDDGAWIPRGDDEVQMNRGYALVDLGGGRTLMLIDHMASPVTSATSLWEVLGKRVVMRAAFPGEVTTIEDRGDTKVFHLSDIISATRVSWTSTPKGGEFQGDCLVDLQGTFVVPEAAAGIAAARPVVATVAKGRARVLHLGLPTADDPKATYDVGKVAGGTRGVSLYARADGWTLVMMPFTAMDVWSKLFHARPGRAWKTGWLAPGDLAKP